MEEGRVRGLKYIYTVYYNCFSLELPDEINNLSQEMNNTTNVNIAMISELNMKTKKMKQKLKVGVAIEEAPNMIGLTPGKKWFLKPLLKLLIYFKA